jgi:hypothetical protein|tara:strand:- start:236 stop:685 length:450 start_codon:yes stop_codon:yes gene_type:complete
MTLPLISKLGGGSITRSELHEHAIKNGWRSGLEESLAAYLTGKGVYFEYEEHRLSYAVPQRQATYTPDFYVTTASGKVIVVETKGRFVTADRQKMLLVKEQHPALDIRFVFSNANTKISKQSRTTYADWCVKHCFPYASRVVPESWLNE